MTHAQAQPIGELWHRLLAALGGADPTMRLLRAGIWTGWAGCLVLVASKWISQPTRETTGWAHVPQTFAVLALIASSGLLAFGCQAFAAIESVWAKAAAVVVTIVPAAAIVFAYFAGHLADRPDSLPGVAHGSESKWIAGMLALGTAPTHLVVLYGAWKLHKANPRSRLIPVLLAFYAVAGLAFDLEMYLVRTDLPAWLRRSGDTTDLFLWATLLTSYTAIAIAAGTLKAQRIPRIA